MILLFSLKPEAYSRHLFRQSKEEHSKMNSLWVQGHSFHEVGIAIISFDGLGNKSLILVATAGPQVSSFKMWPCPELWNVCVCFNIFPKWSMKGRKSFVFWILEKVKHAVVYSLVQMLHRYLRQLCCNKVKCIENNSCNEIIPLKICMCACHQHKLARRVLLIQAFVVWRETAAHINSYFITCLHP